MLAFSDAPAPLVSYFALASGLATYVSAYGYTTVRYATGYAAYGYAFRSVNETADATAVGG